MLFTIHSDVLLFKYMGSKLYFTDTADAMHIDVLLNIWFLTDIFPTL